MSRVPKEAHVAPLGRVRFEFFRRRRLPVFSQVETTECGLTCLAMILHWHGNEIGLSGLRAKFPPSSLGISLQSLIEQSERLGLQARAIRLDLDELTQLAVPAILHWGLNHFVVLARATRSEVVIHDPFGGRRTLSYEEVSREFTGVALELRPNAAFTKTSADDRNRLRLGHLFRSVPGIVAAFARVLVLALLLEIVALLTPLFVRVVMDRVLTTSDYSFLSTLGIGFLLLVLVETAIGAVRSWTVAAYGTSFALGCTGAIFSHALRLPHTYFQRRHIGDVVSRFDSIESIQQTISTHFVETILEGAFGVITLFVLLSYSWQLAGICFLSVSLYGATRLLSIRKLQEVSLQHITASAVRQSCLIESIRAVDTIRLHNHAPFRWGRFMNAAVDAQNIRMDIQRINVGFNALNTVVFGAKRVGLIWLGATMVMAGELTAGMLVAAIAYSELFSARTVGLLNNISELKMLQVQVDRVSDITATEPECYVDTDYTGTMPRADLQLRNISFRYSDSDPWIVRNFSLQVAEGESVALVGPSGCGKTTLAKILLGLLEPCEGTVAIGGIDLKTFGKRTYRTMVSAVMQDDQLFSGTIAENIALFEPHAKTEDIELAARSACIHDDIARMTMGYRTLIGDMGSALSGGQKQRIFLARALYRRPKILILDEATSHLDPPREAEINAIVACLKITRVLIAHRTETILGAERVVSLQPFNQEIKGGQAKNIREADVCI